MTLNDLERCNSPYFVFFSPNSIDFQADYITVVENSSSLPLLAKTITHPAAQSLCDSWASCPNLPAQNHKICVIMTNRQTIHKFLCWYEIIGTLTAGQVGCSLGPMSFRQLSNGTKMEPMQCADVWSCKLRMLMWIKENNNTFTEIKVKHLHDPHILRIWTPIDLQFTGGPHHV